MSIDYYELRERLLKLKTDNKMNNYEFCQIYAPEKCRHTKSNAENYISAVFTGRNYPKETNGPVIPELKHLQNLIDSGKFPGLTMNYLLYGDDTLAVEVKTLDLDIHHWTLSDFCEFVLAIVQEYPHEISYASSEPENYEVKMDDGEILQETKYNSVLRFLEMDSVTDEGCGIGIALRSVLEEFQKFKDIPLSKAREVAIKELLNAIRSDERYSLTKLDDCHTGKQFIDYDEYGIQIKGLKIE